MLLVIQGGNYSAQLQDKNMLGILRGEWGEFSLTTILKELLSRLSVMLGSRPLALALHIALVVRVCVCSLLLPFASIAVRLKPALPNRLFSHGRDKSFFQLVPSQKENPSQIARSSFMQRRSLCVRDHHLQLFFVNKSAE